MNSVLSQRHPEAPARVRDSTQKRRMHVNRCEAVSALNTFGACSK